MYLLVHTVKGEFWFQKNPHYADFFGKHIVNIVPTPTSLSTVTLPPCASIRCLTIAKSETRAAGISASCTVHSIKSFEQSRQLRLINSHPFISDFDDRFIVRFGCIDCNCRFFFRIIDGVCQQIDQYLNQSVEISFN